MAAVPVEKPKKPYVWDGNKTQWVEWSTKVKSYARQISPRLKDAMKNAESRDEPITNAMLLADAEKELNARLPEPPPELTNGHAFRTNQAAGAGKVDRVASSASQQRQSANYTEERDDSYISCLHHVHGLPPRGGGCSGPLRRAAALGRCSGPLLWAAALNLPSTFHMPSICH